VQPFTYTFSVLAEHIDFNHHVNNVTYLVWMMEAAARHSNSVGFGFEACRELGGTWVAKSHAIEYRKPAYEGEELRMETWIASIGKVMSVRRYRLIRPADDTVICEGETKWAFVDAQRQRPTKIPKEIVEAFSETSS